jgi:hexosaminidase
MYERMAVVGQKLQSYGIGYRATEEHMLERMSGDPNPEALRVLAAVVQPPEGYEREQIKHNTSLTPLNHLIDAVQPESDQAREFHKLCDAIASGKATPEQWQQARAWLALWRDNDAKLAPALPGSEITAELVPLSSSLRQVAEIGLDALNHLQKATAIASDLQKQNLAVVAAAEKPIAVLKLMVAPSVELLVKAEKVQ